MGAYFRVGVLLTNFTSRVETHYKGACIGGGGNSRIQCCIQSTNHMGKILHENITISFPSKILLFSFSFSLHMLCLKPEDL